MSDGKASEWDSLREKLIEEGGFPKVYMFKFIIPSDNQKLAQVQALFGPEAIVNMRSSKNGKYLSISANEMMLNVDNIILRYEEAMKVEGIIAL
ncbi:MAG: DUF493 family protein [Flavobacteriales bacterium]|nr:DUF493 family protein [Flavobacteriales bacterium]